MNNRTSESVQPESPFRTRKLSAEQIAVVNERAGLRHYAGQLANWAVYRSYPEIYTPKPSVEPAFPAEHTATTVGSIAVSPDTIRQQGLTGSDEHLADVVDLATFRKQREEQLAVEAAGRVPSGPHDPGQLDAAREQVLRAFGGAPQEGTDYVQEVA